MACPTLTPTSSKASVQRCCSITCAITPSTKIDSLSFCHFAAEFKRTDGNLHQTRLQAAYDGAVLVNARERALERALERARANPSADIAALDKAANEPAVSTCVTDGKVAEVYAHYYDGEYHQDVVGCESLLGSNRGRELIRNAQDYARSKSYELANLLGADMEEEKAADLEEKTKSAKGWFWWWLVKRLVQWRLEQAPSCRSR